MRALLDWIKGWATSNADHLYTQFIPDGSDALTPNVHYIRLWLTDMYLARDREWFQNRYPMVHATVQLKYAGREASFSSLARAPEGRLGPAERQHYPLTPLLPWNGGVVEIEAGLSALEGANVLAPALDVLQQVSRLVAPPLSAGLGVAEQVGTAIHGLLRAGSDPVVLGLHQAFAVEGGGAIELRRGHFVVAGKNGPLDTEHLAVVGGRLTSGGAGDIVTGTDYMVVGVSGLAERDDWRFPALEEVITKAIEAAVKQDRPTFEIHRSAAVAMALTSSDLTPVDRQRVARAVRDELQAAEAAGQGALGAEPPSVEQIVNGRALPYEEARNLPELSLEEVLAGN